MGREPAGSLEEAQSFVQLASVGSSRKASRRTTTIFLSTSTRVEPGRVLVIWTSALCDIQQLSLLISSFLISLLTQPEICWATLAQH
jgi:hypothetical protein